MSSSWESKISSPPPKKKIVVYFSQKQNFFQESGSIYPNGRFRDIKGYQTDGKRDQWKKVNQGPQVKRPSVFFYFISYRCISINVKRVEEEIILMVHQYASPCFPRLPLLRILFKGCKSKSHFGNWISAIFASSPNSSKRNRSTFSVGYGLIPTIQLLPRRK